MIEGKRILVVEDEFIVATMLCDILEDAGAEPVGPIGRVDEGLATIASEAIDGAVLDWNLNGESGTQVAAALDARGIPFVIATGYGKVEGEFAQRPIVSKPYAPSLLLERLASILTGVDLKA